MPEPTAPVTPSAVPTEVSGDAPSGTRRRGPLTAAVAVSGVRCMLTYILIPAFAPLLGATVAVTTPVVLALYVLGTVMSVRATWRCASSDRWAMATIASALVSLNVLGLLSTLAGRWTASHPWHSVPDRGGPHRD